MATKAVFSFPIPAPLSNGRLKLIPFDPDLHSTAFISQSINHPGLFAHMPLRPFLTVAELNTALFDANSIISFSNPAHFVFAIIDKTRAPSPEDEEGELAGTISYINTSKVNLSSEIGIVVILPKYQRSHVTTNAVGLLLQCAFKPPEEGGLGLKRMHWTCSTVNVASAKVAERMGHEKVGVIPYHYRFPNGKRYGKQGNGKPLPPGGEPDDVWRDTIVYSLSWDVWEVEAREKVEKAMSRVMV
jgi:RimJ/RimL family protein N-acetyltransferase